MQSAIYIGIIIGVAIYISELIDLQERLAWADNLTPPSPKRWWQPLSTLAFSTVAITGGVVFYNGQSYTVDSLDILVMLSSGFTILSFLWAHDKQNSLPSVLRWGVLGCTAIALGLALEFEQCVIIVASGSMIYLLIGVAEELRAGSLRKGRHYRFFGGVGCNKQATHCIFVGLSSVYLSNVSLLPLFVTLALLFFSLVILILTRSIANWWSIFIVLSVWLFLAYPDTRNELTKYILIGATTALILLTTNSGRGIVHWLIFVGRTNVKITYLAGRWDIWRFVWSDVMKYPFFGQGYGSFWNVNNQARFLQSGPLNIPLTHSHSIYLELLLNGGFVALTLFFMMGAVGAFYAMDESGPAGAFVAALIAYVVFQGVVESAFTLPQFRSFTFILILVSIQ
ncbi:O-antigen ligase family protein [Pseudomonadota bacterium]